MKKLLPYIILLLPAPLAAQFTNSGNLKFHDGTTIAVKGDFTNNGTLTDAGTMVYFNGTSNQNIGGTSATSLSNATLDNAGGLTLLNALTVSNSLTLTSGVFSLGTYTLTIDNSAITAVSRTGGCIKSEQTDNSGKIKWNIGATTGAHVFPFGAADGTYIPFTLDLTAGTIGNVTVSTYHTAADNTPYPVSPIAVTHVNNTFGIDNSANTVDRFWQIDKDGVSGTATLTFNATPAEVGTLVSLQAQRWNSAIAGWDSPLPSQVSLGLGAVVPGVTNFSPWTLSGNMSALPIQLLSFSAAPNNQGEVDLGWTTVSEINSNYFTIEKTIDMKNFETVAVLQGAGTTNETQHYYSKDALPYIGISYYRLKQTDFDGNSTYSDFIPVKLNKPGVSLAVYPNPASDLLNVTVYNESDQDVLVKLIDASGKCVYATYITVENGMGRISFNPAVMAGVYMLVTEGTNFREQARIVMN